MSLDQYCNLLANEAAKLDRELVARACFDASIRVAWGELEAVAVLVDVVADRIARFRIRVEAEA